MKEARATIIAIGMLLSFPTIIAKSPRSPFVLKEGLYGRFRYSNSNVAVRVLAWRKNRQQCINRRRRPFCAEICRWGTGRRGDFRAT